MLVHGRVTPSIKFTGTHLYTWVERGTVRVKCLAQEHNSMSPARTRTWITRSGVKHTDHEATVPPTVLEKRDRICNICIKIEFISQSIAFTNTPNALVWCTSMAEVTNNISRLHVLFTETVATSLSHTLHKPTNTWEKDSERYHMFLPSN